MKRTVLVFGLISGAFCALMEAATVPFVDRIGFERAQYVGYAIILLSFLLVYAGIHSYRENYGHGQISFRRGLAVGILITLITCAFYVAAWEILYYNFLPGFMEEYGAYVMEKARAAGENAAAIQAKLVQLKQLQEMYASPWKNAAITFIEPFPIGLGITVMSAAVLRRKAPAESTVAAK